MLVNNAWIVRVTTRTILLAKWSNNFSKRSWNFHCIHVGSDIENTCPVKIVRCGCHYVLRFHCFAPVSQVLARTVDCRLVPGRTQYIRDGFFISGQQWIDTERRTIILWIYFLFGSPILCFVHIKWYIRHDIVPDATKFMDHTTKSFRARNSFIAVFIIKFPYRW